MSLKNEYPSFDTWKWKNYDETKVVSIKDFVEEHIHSDFYIGTDSQNYKKKKGCCTFTTALVAYNKGKGGSVILHSDTTGYMQHLRQRLLIEAMRSLESAWFLSSLLPEDRVITIHLDVNENTKYKSSKYKDELVGMVMAQGFKCAHKPYSWAASGVADAKT
jgi:predicted RNase H-related nuclease YkuK (DUF458 family)